MKAIRVHEFGGPEKLLLEELPDLQPGDKEIVVEIHAAGVNPVDTYIRAGTYSRLPVLPYTPGHDGAGVVLACGSGTDGFQPGDRVYIAGSITGTYAEQARCLESRVYSLPQEATFAQGAAIGIPYGTAYRALFQKALQISPQRTRSAAGSKKNSASAHSAVSAVSAQRGQSVLIHGASGGVGIAAVQLSRAFGLKIIGTAGTEEGRALVRKQGADTVLDHSSPNLVQEVLQLTNGKGVDIILEMLANQNLKNDLLMIARNGRIVVIGNRGTIEINPRDLMSRDAMLLGMLLFNATEQELSVIHEGLATGLETGVLQPVIGVELSLSEASRAHEMVFESGKTGKIVLIP